MAAAGVPDEQIRIAWVPGAWELPIAAQRMIDSTVTYDGVLCFGCVIRGETTHDQHINTTVSEGLGRLSLLNDVPIGFGLLTVNSLDQAIARSGGAVGNKGEETATAVIEMLKLFDSLDAEEPQ